MESKVIREEAEKYVNNYPILPTSLRELTNIIENFATSPAAEEYWGVKELNKELTEVKLKRWEDQVKIERLTKEIERLRANVPQLCPKCNGQGTVSKPPYVPGALTEYAKENGLTLKQLAHFVPVPAQEPVTSHIVKQAMNIVKKDVHLPKNIRDLEAQEPAKEDQEEMWNEVFNCIGESMFDSSGAMMTKIKSKFTLQRKG